MFVLSLKISQTCTLVWD